MDNDKVKVLTIIVLAIVVIFLGLKCDTQQSKKYDTGFDDGYASGYDEGRIDGYKDGHNEGYVEGYIDGYDDGKKNKSPEY